MRNNVIQQITEIIKTIPELKDVEPDQIRQVILSLYFQNDQAGQSE